MSKKFSSMIIFTIIMQIFCGPYEKFPRMSRRETKSLIKTRGLTSSFPIYTTSRKKEDKASKILFPSRNADRNPIDVKNNNIASNQKQQGACRKKPAILKSMPVSKAIGIKHHLRPIIYLPVYIPIKNDDMMKECLLQNNIIESINKCKMYSLKGEADYLRKVYTEIKKLGEGSYGTVHLYKVRDKDAHVAVKLTAIKNKISSDLQEYEVCKELIELNHRNIIKIYGLFLGKKYMLIFMNYERGYSLSQIVLKYNVHYEFKREIMAQVTEGIAFLHRSDIVHGDLSPNNIMIDLRGIVKLIDFGFSRNMKMGEEIRIPPTSTIYLSNGRALGIYKHFDDYHSLGICIFFIHEEKLPGYREDFIKKVMVDRHIDFEFGINSTAEEVDIVIQLIDDKSDFRSNPKENTVKIIRKHNYFKGTSFARLETIV